MSLLVCMLLSVVLIPTQGSTSYFSVNMVVSGGG